MPAFVAAQSLVTMLLGLENGAIGLLVADRNGLGIGVRAQKLEVAKAAREPDLGVVGQVLPGENEQSILVKGLLDAIPRGLVQVGEVDIGDRGAQGGIDGRDGRLHEILLPGGSRHGGAWSRPRFRSSPPRLFWPRQLGARRRSASSNRGPNGAEP
jgi:hypothetical protein